MSSWDIGKISNNDKILIKTRENGKWGEKKMLKEFPAKQ